MFSPYKYTLEQIREKGLPEIKSEILAFVKGQWSIFEFINLDNMPDTVQSYLECMTSMIAYLDKDREDQIAFLKLELIGMGFWIERMKAKSVKFPFKRKYNTLVESVDSIFYAFY